MGGWGVRGRPSQVLRLSCCSKSHIYHTATSPRQEKSLTGRPGEGCVICSSGWMTLNTREWQVRRMKGDLVPGPCHFKCCPTFKGGARSSEGDKLPGKYLCAGSHIVGPCDEEIEKKSQTERKYGPKAFKHTRRPPPPPPPSSRSFVFAPLENMNSGGGKGGRGGRRRSGEMEQSPTLGHTEEHCT